MLYTIVPTEAILDEESSPELVEVSHAGITMLVAPMDRAQGRIVQVISTDPSHFLNPAYQPGNSVPLYTPGKV